MIWIDAAEDEVAIGDSERSAVSVAGRARVCAGRLRPDPEAHPVEAADRPAARRDRVDLHHRGADSDAGNDALVGKLELAGIMRHVGRGAAHVETDQPVALVWC